MDRFFVLDSLVDQLAIVCSLILPVMVSGKQIWLIKIILQNFLVSHFLNMLCFGFSLLKIWNMNKYTGVLGVYNCQGAAWSSTERKNIFHQTKTDSLTGSIRGRDVHSISEASTDPTTWNGDCAVYSQSRGELIVMPYNVSLPVSLKIREHEIFTVSPISHLVDGVSFAPIGLVNMYNSGGAIEGLRYEAEKMKVVMEVKGCGKFGSYSSVKPKRCVVESNEIAFEYDSSSGLVTFELDKMPIENKRFHLIQVEL